MTRPLFIAIVLLTFSAQSVLAKGKPDTTVYYKNRIQIHVGAVVPLDGGLDDAVTTLPSNMGFTLSRIIYKKVSLNFTYHKWYNWWMLTNQKPDIDNGYDFGVKPEDGYIKDGDRDLRYNFEVFGLYLNYAKQRRNDEFYAGFGIIYARGKERVFKSGYPNLRKETNDVNSWGQMVDIGYNRYAFKRRLNFGFMLPMAVQMTRAFPVIEFYPGIAIGYNFNFKKPHFPSELRPF